MESMILEGLKAIRERKKSLDEEIERVKPFVIAHFNGYVEKVINPSLPNGYSMPCEADCSSNGGKFTIDTPQYLNTPHGPSRGLFEFDGELLDLCIAYEEKTPWVGMVNLRIALGE